MAKKFAYKKPKPQKFWTFGTKAVIGSWGTGIATMAITRQPVGFFLGGAGGLSAITANEGKKILKRLSFGKFKKRRR